MSGIAHVLLNLALLPAGGRVTELGFIEEVADHGPKASVDLPSLATTHLVHSGLHVVVDAALGDTA
jgi:hypothetical protein